MLKRMLYLIFKAVQVLIMLIAALPHLVYYIFKGKDTWARYDDLGIVDKLEGFFDSIEDKL